MDDYFSRFIEEQRKKEDAEKIIKSYMIAALILFILLVIMIFRYSILLGKYEDLRYDYEEIKQEYNIEVE